MNLLFNQTYTKKNLTKYRPDDSVNRTGISQVLKISTNFQEAVINLNFCDLVEKGASL